MRRWIARGAGASLLVVGTAALPGGTPGAVAGNLPAAGAFAAAVLADGERDGGIPAFRFLADPCVAGLLGDVTDDAVANVIDAQQIARAAAGLAVSPTVSGRLATHGDVTGDGTPNVIDAQQIARVAAGLSSPFPIGEGMCTITVNTSSTGTNVDPDGYGVEVDGSPSGTIDATGTMELGGFDVGSYQVALTDIAGNCSVTNGAASRSVSVVGGGTASVTFEIECTGGTTIGTLTIQNETVGSNQPTEDYLISLDGGATRAMPVGGAAAMYTDIPSGVHSVEVTNLPGNCTIDGGNPNAINIEFGTTHTIHSLAITCT